MTVGLTITILFIIICLECVPTYCHNYKLDEQWKSYKIKYGKQYDDSREEKARITWERNRQYVHMHNLGQGMRQSNYRLSANPYSDMDHEEFAQQMFGYKRSNPRIPAKYFQPMGELQLPPFVDWRTEGLVTPVKNQDRCGCCYAFSATGSLEGQMKRKTGRLISLSEQNIVDCSISEGNEACSGGTMEQAFEYIEKNGGLDSEASYPFTATENICRYNPADAVAGLKGFLKIPEGNEMVLLAAVATVGPISVAINANPRTFQFYSEGIYDDPACLNAESLLDHAVLVIGYGTVDGLDYWLLKNSWGPEWGENGFMRILRNRNNLCGISLDATFPMV